MGALDMAIPSQAMTEFALTLSAANGMEGVETRRAAPTSRAAIPLARQGEGIVQATKPRLRMEVAAAAKAVAGKKIR